MPTRSTRGEASTKDDITIATEEGRETIREYFATVEKQVLQKITSLVMKPERIQMIAEDALSDTVLRIDNSLRQLKEGQDGLRTDLDAFTREPCKIELRDIKDELAVMRDKVNGEFQRLWTAINALQGKPRAIKDIEPMEVRDDEDERRDSSSRRKKGSGSRGARSRKGRASRSSSSRHKRRDDRPYESGRDSSSSEESDAGESEPEGDDIRVADRDCRRILSVDRYRLEDREPERDLRLRTAKVLAHLRHLYEGDRFDGSDPLTVLPFLEELKTTFDDAGLCEGDAKHMVRYFIDGEVARLFKSLSPREKRSYPQIVKWLLRTYVRENMLLDARERFLTRSQKPTETELEYSKALSDLSRRCAGMISERELVNRFVRGLSPSIRTHVQDRVTRNTSWAIAVATATDHGVAHREAQKEQASRREPHFESYPRRRIAPGKGKAYAIRPLADDDSSVDEWWARDQEPTVFKDAARKSIGAIHQGSIADRDEDSIASFATSAESFDERYYTPRSSFGGSASRDRPLPVAQRKVMLPPGVPYPAKRTPQGSSINQSLPCLGCGKLGHWLADCPNVNSRLKDLALETLRTRKQARTLRYSESREPSPDKAPTMTVAQEEQTMSAPAQGEEREKSSTDVL